MAEISIFLSVSSLLFSLISWGFSMYLFLCFVRSEKTNITLPQILKKTPKEKKKTPVYHGEEDLWKKEQMEFNRR